MSQANPNDSRVWALSVPLDVVTFDIYRDIHKGIRTELFGVTAAAGSMDPHDHAAAVTLGARMSALVALLESHASLEDRYLTPLLTRHAPELARTITSDHAELDGQLAQLRAALSALPETAPKDKRLAAHRFYLGIASFTSDYLEHQAVEELEVMPALSTAYTLEELLRVNGEMVGTIAPEKMAATLALLLPAMNIEDRAELMNGMKAGAPPAVFDGVRRLAREVLPAGDYEALAQRVA